MQDFVMRVSAVSLYYCRPFRHFEAFFMERDTSSIITALSKLQLHYLFMHVMVVVAHYYVDNTLNQKRRFSHCFDKFCNYKIHITYIHFDFVAFWSTFAIRWHLSLSHITGQVTFNYVYLSNNLANTHCRSRNNSFYWFCKV